MNVARTWAFSDGGYRSLQYKPGSYNEDMFKVSSVNMHIAQTSILQMTQVSELIILLICSVLFFHFHFQGLYLLTFELDV